MDKREFRISTERGPGAVVIDGVDISRSVSRVTMDWPAGNIMPTLYLEASMPGAIEGAGLVLERDVEPPDPTEAVLAFLRGVDSAALEEDALSLLGQHEGIESTGDAILAQLQIYAQAESDGNDDRP